jgi:hypothetical protein
VRYISFTIPAAAYGEDRAIRIRLDSLHHPTPPPPGTAPSFSLLEGQDRYLNTVAGAVSRCCNPNSYPTSCNSVVNCSSDANCAGLGVNSKCFKNLCPDSPAFATFFRCAYVSCNPQYRDWSDFSGSMTYATGETIIPSSSYSVSQLSASCAGNEANCPAASAPLIVTTERWTNLDCSEGNHGIPNAIDISQVVDKVKDSRFIKPRTQFRSALLNPLTLVSAQDAARVVDAVKGFQYPFNINCTTLCNNNAQCQSGLCTGSPSHCSAPNTCASNADCVGLQGGHTCSANGFCTNVKDSCSGLCQP